MFRTAKRQPTDRPTTDGRRRGRGPALKLGLGALALVGIGSSLTAAAWTDDANFKADATSASVSLYAYKFGSTGCTSAPTTGATTGCWIDAESAAPVSIPSSAFVGLLPTNTKTYTAYIYNAGTSNLVLTTTTSDKDGIFVGSSPATVTPGTTYDITSGANLAAGAPLPAGHLASVVLTVAPGALWGSDAAHQTEYAGKSGKVTVTFTGTAA